LKALLLGGLSALPLGWSPFGYVINGNSYDSALARFAYILLSVAALAASGLLTARALSDFIMSARGIAGPSLRAILIPLFGAFIFLTILSAACVIGLVFSLITTGDFSRCLGGLIFIGAIVPTGLMFTIPILPLFFPYSLLCQYILSRSLRREAAP